MCAFEEEVNLVSERDLTLDQFHENLEKITEELQLKIQEVFAK